MLFLTWALLFLLLCLAPAANAESKVQINIEQLGSFGVESETATPSVGVISEVVWKGNVLCSNRLYYCFIFFVFRRMIKLNSALRFDNPLWGTLISSKLGQVILCTVLEFII